MSVRLTAAGAGDLICMRLKCQSFVKIFCCLIPANAEGVLTSFEQRPDWAESQLAFGGCPPELIATFSVAREPLNLMIAAFSILRATRPHGDTKSL